MNFGILPINKNQLLSCKSIYSQNKSQQYFIKNSKFLSLLFSTKINYAHKNTRISMPYFEDWQIVGVCNRLHLENTIFQMLEHSMWDIYS